MRRTKVLFVCLGNICRSPTADAVFASKVAAAGLADSIIVDSAGTGAWHAGEPADTRAQSHAAKRGIDMSTLRARQLKAADFNEFDYILAMDDQNFQDIRTVQADAVSQEIDAVSQEGIVIKRLLDYLPRASLSQGSELLNHDNVPDPYYGGDNGFELVLDLIDSACDPLLAEIAKRHR